MKRFHIWKWFVLAAGLILINRWADVQISLNISRLVDGITQMDTLLYKFAFLGVTIILLIVGESFYQLAKVKYMNRIAYEYRKNILRSILQVKLSNLTSKKRAEYISIMNNDIQMVLNDYYGNLLNLIYTVATVAFSVKALLSLNVYILLIIILQIVLLTINPFLFRKPLQQSKENQSIAKKDYNFKLTDFIEGIHIIKTYLCEKIMTKQVNEASEEINAAEFSFAKTQMYANLFSMTVGYVCNFLIVAVGVYSIYKGNLTVGALLAILQITDLLANPITTVTYYINSMMATKSVKDKLDRMISDAEKKESERKDIAINTIAFNDVSLKIDEKNILTHITAKFEMGKKYLIVGDNGSGKSTLLKLIYQLYDDYEGQILINEQIWNGQYKDGFYKKVAMVFQDNYIFTDTLRNNITLFESYESERIEEYIHKFGLEKLDQGILSMNHLSGGERQKIAIIRALIRNPKFLLLDEATSALDFEGQRQVEDILLQEPCCVIHISHHYHEDLVKQYDHVLHIKDGKIV